MPIATAYKITGSYAIQQNFRKLLQQVESDVKKCGNKMNMQQLNAIVDKTQRQARKWARGSGITKRFGKAVLMLTCAKMGRRSKFRLDHITDYLDIGGNINELARRVMIKLANKGLKPIQQKSLKKSIPLLQFAIQNNMAQWDIGEIRETVEYQNMTTPLMINDLLSLFCINKTSNKIKILNQQEATVNTICELLGKTISKNTAIKTLFYAVPAMYNKDGKPMGLLRAIAFSLKKWI